MTEVGEGIAHDFSIIIYKKLTSNINGISPPPLALVKCNQAFDCFAHSAVLSSNWPNEKQSMRVWGRPSQYEETLFSYHVDMTCDK